MLAVESGHRDTMGMLLKMGADVNAVDAKRSSALHRAVGVISVLFLGVAFKYFVLISMVNVLYT